MKIAAMCKHCGTQHTWDRMPDGSYAAPGPASGSHFVYACTVSSSKVCEPHIASHGERMVRELAQGINRRFRSGGRSAKRR
jgi:hypothetical protein